MTTSKPSLSPHGGEYKAAVNSANAATDQEIAEAVREAVEPKHTPEEIARFRQTFQRRRPTQ